MRGIRCVIFDVDGTLLLSQIDFSRMRRRILCLASRMRLFVPSGRLPALELVGEVCRLAPAPAARRFASAAMAIIRDEETRAARAARPAPGAAALLRELRGRGIAVAVITRNSRTTVLPLLKKYRLPCDILLAREDVARVKPHPGHGRAALRRLGVPAGQALCVGDHPMDIRMARRMGCVSAAVCTGGQPRDAFVAEEPDFIYENLEGVARLFGIVPLAEGKLPAQELDFLLRRTGCADQSVSVGPAAGVDCAVVRSSGRVLLAKSDPITLAPEEIGAYLLAVNANDISAAGGRPKWLLTTLLFPKGCTFPQVEDVFARIGRECRRHGVSWIGGHTEITPAVRQPVACGCLWGEPIARARMKRPRPGDAVLLAGYLGVEAASILARRRAPSLVSAFGNAFLDRAAAALVRPGISISALARDLWRNFDIRLMHDPTEGGISAAVYEVCRRYRVGCVIRADRLRFYPPALRLARHLRISPLGMISSGCLLVILDPHEAARACAYLRRRKTVCEIAGRIVPESNGIAIATEKGLLPLPEFPADELAGLRFASERGKRRKADLPARRPSETSSRAGHPVRRKVQ